MPKLSDTLPSDTLTDDHDLLLTADHLVDDEFAELLDGVEVGRVEATLNGLLDDADKRIALAAAVERIAR